MMRRWSGLWAAAVLMGGVWLRGEVLPLRSVRFEGPPVPGLGEVLEAVPPGVGEGFDPARAGALSDAVLEAWRRAGYPLARVNWRAGPVENGEGLELVMVSEPGDRYRFGAVGTVPGTPEAVRDWAAEAGVVEGAWFSPEVMGALRERVMEALRGQGYGFAEFTVEPVWRDAEAAVDVTIAVDAGPRMRLRQLRVSGNGVTEADVIGRELDLRAGEWFHAPTLRRFERRLADSGLFRSVDVQYREAGEGGFDIEVAVEEAKTGRVETGVSYGTEEGPAVLLQAREVNFALRPPFRGGGLVLEGSVQAGPEIVRVDGGLTFPRAGGSLWRVTGTGFYEDNAYLSDVYDQRSQGAGVVAAVPLSGRLSVFTGPQWTSYRLENVREGFAESAGVEPEVNLTGWQGGGIWDGTDRRFRPRRGARVEQSLLWGTEVLGGDTEVLEVSARGAVYFNPVGEHVLLFRGGVQSVDGLGETERVPVVLRTYLGGSATLRGFEYRSVSPLDGEGVPVGGESAWWVSAEYLLPVLPRLDVSVYADAGDVGGEAWRFSGEGPVSNWGVGLVIRAENFPVRVDVAFPLETLEGDRANEPGGAHVSFSAGYVF